MKVTQIAFGIEKKWSHRHRDARLIPWHWCLCALILGIICGDRTGISVGVPLHIIYILILFLYLFVLFILNRHNEKTRNHGYCSIRWLLVWMCLWFAFGYYQGSPRSVQYPPENTICVFKGTVESVPPGVTQIQAMITEWRCGGITQTGSLRARMSLSQEALDPETSEIHRGTTFRTHGQWIRYESPDVPGTFDARRWAKYRRIAGRIKRPNLHSEMNSFEILSNPGSLRQNLETGRRIAYKKLSEISPEGIVPALVLGTTRDIESSTRTTFGRLGIAHVLAVSGLHFGIIAAVFHIIFRFIVGFSPYIMRRYGRNKAALALSIPALATYLFFVGVPISAQRALLMTAIYCLARLLAVHSERKRSLALAGIILLAIEPYAVFEISYQLSMSAVLGILCGLDIYERDIKLHIEEQFWPQWVKTSLSWLINMLIMSLSTALTTAPFVIYHFGQLPILGILTNLIVIPYITFLLMPAAMISAFFAVTGLPGVSVLCTIAGFLEKLLVQFANIVIENIPLTYVEITPLSIYIILSSVTAFVLLYLFRPNRSRIVLSAGISIIMILALFISQLNPRLGMQPDDLRISFVAMGQADATLVEFPDGRVMLVDAGSELGREENGTQTKLIPYLRYLGIRNINILAITHSDYDHVAGLQPLLEYASIGEIWHNGIEPLKEGNDWRKHIPEHIPIVDARNLLPIDQNDTQIEVLWPNPKSISILESEDKYNANESSLVLLITMHTFSILLMGDAGTVVEQALLEDPRIAGTTVIKAGHHGSKSASSAPWVRAVQPKYVVFSMGKDNRYHFPHLEVQNNYLNVQARMYRTGDQGTVRMTTNGYDIYTEVCR
ncbi:MAG: DNA internalization-related competence protein ComEC/Rec2 [Proteobacteria bacterium]|nr:DNA internalization-related competence protein ComEC/Rec2 [Pseudomonadota bacterium]